MSQSDGSGHEQFAGAGTEPFYSELQAWSGGGGYGTVWSLVDEIGSQFGMSLAEHPCAIQSHDHHGGGYSIGCGTVFGKDCG